MRFVRSHGGDVASLFPAFGIGQISWWEERCRRGRGAEYHRGSADGGFEQAIVLVVARSQDLEFRNGERGGGGVWEIERGERGWRYVWLVEALDEGLRRVEGPVDDVDVVDFCPTEEERQADVPVGLFAGAEDD